ncbi:MAG: PSD1 and planctomycete cytochrome C domain-containing protein [Pirellulales bacterium]
MRQWFQLIALGVVLVTQSRTGVAAEPVDFAHDVLPILRQHCATCHTNGRYEGELSLDTREAILESEVAIPGKSHESTLLERLSSDDPDVRMPAEAEPLSEEQIAIVARWIDADLPWEEGFTFKEQRYVALLKPRRPEVPTVGPSGEHPIDRFLDAYYSEYNITLPAAIDDAVFLRRVSIDLVGLLPTPDAVFAFVKDHDPQKRQHLVRALLEDREVYTQHWLTFWNDLLRNDYEGTGFIDGGRSQISHWLYQALRDNTPYDQFVRQLISPKPESEGFIKGIVWRGRVNASQVPEVQFAQNVGQVFLGLNLKCASCHDSFIDDWKLTDSYGMAAIISDKPLELHRCDKPTGEMAHAKFLFPELGTIDAAAPREERLAQLADLLTHEDNGRLTRTMVNRLWDRLMGRGLVHPVDSMGSPPWNADLLDYLACFLADHDYDLKQLLAHVATSRAYQSQSAVLEEEPIAGEFVYTGPIARRLTAEQFMDAIWQITGTGPNDPHKAIEQLVSKSKQGPTVRASLVTANLLMRSLGRPNREQVVTTRPDQLTTLEALDLSNGEILAELASQGAANLRKEHPDWDAERMIDHVYRSALSRAPTPPERELCIQLCGSPITDDGLADVLWSVFMLPEFQLIR